LNDQLYKEVDFQIDSLFADTKELETELEEAFKHYKFYYPDSALPRVITMNSVFNYAVAKYKNDLGIGLEYYLGADNSVIELLPVAQFPQYMKSRMSREYMMTEVVKGWLQNKYMDQSVELNFLEIILEWGKLMYLVDAIVPNDPPNRKFKYTEEEFEFCEENEYQIYKTIIEKKILYSKDRQAIMKWTEEGPNTFGVKNSPSKIGRWLGWKMVKSYLAKNKDVSLQELMQEKQYQKMIKAYKPKQ